MIPTKYKDMTYEQRRAYHNAKKREAYRKSKLSDINQADSQEGVKPDSHTPRKWRGFVPDTVRRLEKEQPMIIQLRLSRLRAEFKKIPILKRPPYDEWLRYRVNEILTQQTKPQ